MKFLSYAQNFEDVILNRAFRGQDQGFYLDVGAAHPVGHSVTKNFYERGWRGINIEPGTAAFALVVEDRKRDVNLNVGISNEAGELKFFEAPDSIGISTFNSDWCEKWQVKDGASFVEKTVPVMTLTQVCERYVDAPIDFLKIDVEGHEPMVLAGADFNRWRPKVVVVEGDRKLYESKLIESNYLHARFDGVNHYFVSEEQAALIPLLAEPVSLVIDDFELYETFCERTGHQSAIRHLNEAKDRANDLARQLDQSQADRAVTAAALEEACQKLELLTRQHESLRSRIAPLIEVKRALVKVNGVFGHPAHKFRRMTSGIRQGVRSMSHPRD